MIFREIHLIFRKFKVGTLFTVFLRVNTKKSLNTLFNCIGEKYIFFGESVPFNTMTDINDKIKTAWIRQLNVDWKTVNFQLF